MKLATTHWNACIAIGLVLLLFTLPLFASAMAQAPIPQEAPTLPETTEPLPELDGHGTGFISPPMDLSHLTGQQGVLRALGAGELPSSWDWRDYGKVTSVKDQGSCGSCYAFAAIANIESEILVDNAAMLPNPDYSENNAKECNWDELYGGGSSCSGGNYDMLVNLFSQKGLVLESCDPYKWWDTSCKVDCSYQKTLLGWKIISGSGVPDTTTLKEYVHACASPIYVALYGGPLQSSYDGSYTIHYTGTQNPTHAVLIVGWSNNLPPKQGETEPADGWIVKNSWGDDWGDNGYFYITYGSAGIGKWSSFMYDWQDYDSEGGLMYYDEAGWGTSWGCGSPTAWGLCEFIPPSDTYATRVEFWTPDAMTDIDIYLYDDFDGTTLSNLLCNKLNINFDKPGYHSVQLDEPLPLTAGDDINVVVKFTTSGYIYPVTADNRGSYETDRTYISCSGASGSWYELGAVHHDDVAIRLRTTNPATITTCNATGVNKTHFQPGESMYVKGSGLAANADYTVWVQNTSVKAGDLFVPEEDDSGSQESVPTDGTGGLGPTEIWAIPGGSFAHHDYDIIVDKQLEGDYTGKLNYASDGKTSAHVGMGGDVGPYPDGDGVLDIGDVILLHNRILQPENPRYVLSSVWAGDCQCDNEIDIGDIILLHNHILQPDNPRYALNCCD